MRCAPRTRKPGPGACWRPPTEGTTRWGWRRWRWPKKVSRPAKRRSRSSRPTGPRRCYRRILLPTTGQRISIGKQERETTEKLSLSISINPGVIMRRYLFLAVASTFLTISPAHSPGAAEITPEQRKAIETIIHDYLMQNPDVLIDSLREAEAKANSDSEIKAAQVLRDRRREVFDDPATPVGGNPQGDVTVVEFFDYRCPYCKQVHPAIQKLLDQDHKLRFVYKEFPVLGEQSDIAAHAALAARLQGKYESFHNALMAAKGQISEELVYRIAGSIGLDVDRL